MAFLRIPPPSVIELIEIKDRRFDKIAETCLDAQRKIADLRAALNKHHPYYYSEGRLNNEIWDAVKALWLVDIARLKKSSVNKL